MEILVTDIKDEYNTIHSQLTKYTEPITITVAGQQVYYPVKFDPILLNQANEILYNVKQWLKAIDQPFPGGLNIKHIEHCGTYCEAVNPEIVDRIKKVIEQYNTIDIGSPIEAKINLLTLLKQFMVIFKQTLNDAYERFIKLSKKYEENPQAKLLEGLPLHVEFVRPIPFKIGLPQISLPKFPTVTIPPLSSGKKIDLPKPKIPLKLPISMPVTTPKTMLPPKIPIPHIETRVVVSSPPISPTAEQIIEKIAQSPLDTEIMWPKEKKRKLQVPLSLTPSVLVPVKEKPIESAKLKKFFEPPTIVGKVKIKVEVDKEPQRVSMTFIEKELSRLEEEKQKFPQERRALLQDLNIENYQPYWSMNRLQRRINQLEQIVKEAKKFKKKYANMYYWRLLETLPYIKGKESFEAIMILDQNGPYSTREEARSDANAFIKHLTDIVSGQEQNLALAQRELFVLMLENWVNYQLDGGCIIGKGMIATKDIDSSLNVELIRLQIPNQVLTEQLKLLYESGYPINDGTTTYLLVSYSWSEKDFALYEGSPYQDFLETVRREDNVESRREYIRIESPLLIIQWSRTLAELVQSDQIPLPTYSDIYMCRSQSLSEKYPEGSWGVTAALYDLKIPEVLLGEKKIKYTAEQEDIFMRQLRAYFIDKNASLIKLTNEPFDPFISLEDAVEKLKQNFENTHPEVELIKNIVLTSDFAIDGTPIIYFNVIVYSRVYEQYETLIDKFIQNKLIPMIEDQYGFQLSIQKSFVEFIDENERIVSRIPIKFS